MCTDEKKVLERCNREPLGGEKAFERQNCVPSSTSISPSSGSADMLAAYRRLKNAAVRNLSFPLADCLIPGTYIRRTDKTSFTARFCRFAKTWVSEEPLNL